MLKPTSAPLQEGYIIMSVKNGYHNVEKCMVYPTMEEAQQIRDKLAAAWNAKDDYYILPMLVL